MILRPITPAERKEVLAQLDQMRITLAQIQKEFDEQNAAKKSVYLNRKERIAVSLLNV